MRLIIYLDAIHLFKLLDCSIFSSDRQSDFRYRKERKSEAGFTLVPAHAKVQAMSNRKRERACRTCWSMERDELSASEREALLSKVMRSQAQLSLKVAAVFLGLIFALPLINKFLPEVASTNIGGFTLTWLILAVLFYPITWVLSKWFINASNKIESELAKQYREGR
jgi:uncharacterized membrane protein (DUF485 family)